MYDSEVGAGIGIGIGIGIDISKNIFYVNLNNDLSYK